MEKKEKGFRNKIRKAGLMTGIIMLVVSMVIEIWLENYYSLVLIIPVLYLNNLRKTL